MVKLLTANCRPIIVDQGQIPLGKTRRPVLFKNIRQPIQAYRIVTESCRVLPNGVWPILTIMGHQLTVKSLTVRIGSHLGRYFEVILIARLNF